MCAGVVRVVLWVGCMTRELEHASMPARKAKIAHVSEKLVKIARGKLDVSAASSWCGRVFAVGQRKLLRLACVSK